MILHDYCSCAGLGADGYASVFGSTTASHLRDAQGGKSKYPDLLTPGLEIVRERYNDTPWIMENVDDRSGKVRAIMAPREGETLIMLCGSMFGLQVQRHRLFLANFPLRRPAPVPDPGKSKSKYRAQGCDHSLFPIDPISGNPRPWGVWHVKGDRIPEGGRTALDEEHGRQVMGSHRSLPWDKLKEGFPPAYTAWIAADLLVELRRREAALVSASGRGWVTPGSRLDHDMAAAEAVLSVEVA